MTSEPKSPRILVVEDDDDQRQLICEALRIYYADAEDRDIVGAANSQECLAQDLPAFDVVLLDYDLPDMSGLHTLGKILERADVPVIFVTGHNDSATAAEAIQGGAQDYIVKLGDYLFAIPVMVNKALRQHQIKRENQALQAQLHAMLDELKQKNIQLEQSLEKVEALATTDHLTGLANRRRFKDVLERCYSEAVRYRTDLTCIMCDLDHYKQLNDTLGHQVGDEMLVLTAEIIRSSLRGSDTAARYGGDEFVLLLPHTSVQEARNVCERIRMQLMAEQEKRGRTGVVVTLSAGIASLESNHASSADELVSLADRALYMAKDQGKDRIVVFSQPGMVNQLTG